MYIAYTLLLTYLFTPLIGLFVYDKKGEKDFGLYACFVKKRLFMHICFVLQIGEKEFDLFYAC